MRDVLRRYQPDRIEDLIALNALYRPGPIKGGMIDDFIERKHGRKKVDLRSAGAEADSRRDLRHHPLPGAGDADRASASPATASARPTCCAARWARRRPTRWPSSASASCTARRARPPPKKAEKLFDLMAEFAGYGFNKSHSAAYGYLAYLTGYLKAHYAGRVHGGAADLGNRQHRQGGEVHQRVPRAGHRDSAARREPSRLEFHPRPRAIRFGLGR